MNRIMEGLNASVLQGLKVTVLKIVQVRYLDVFLLVYIFIYLFAFAGVNLEVLWLSRALSTYTQNRILGLVFNIFFGNKFCF